MNRATARDGVRNESVAEEQAFTTLASFDSMMTHLVVPHAPPLVRAPAEVGAQEIALNASLGETVADIDVPVRQERPAR
ncbi:MAG TPA: hypothetical protein VGC51_11700 [Hansschlegelia sp.]